MAYTHSHDLGSILGGFAASLLLWVICGFYKGVHGRASIYGGTFWPVSASAFLLAAWAGVFGYGAL
jgi:hypothetical protein